MIRFYNGKLLSLSGGFEISDWEVWVEETMILYVGPAIGAHPPFEREIDLKGNLLMPGFKNAHAHSAMTFLRSYADDLPLQSWLFDKVFPLEAKLTPDDIYALTKLAILEYLKGGITSAFDMYYKRDAFAQASIDCGFRMVLCGALAAGDDWTVGEMDTIKFNNLHPLISYIPGIHAEYTANLDLLMFMKMLLDEYKMPFFTHNSETKREVEECIERHGLTPTQLFEENGLFEHGGGGFHCVWFDETDMDIFARRGLYAVTCPASNAKLASGIAPVSEFLRRKIPLAIGHGRPGEQQRAQHVPRNVSRRGAAEAPGGRTPPRGDAREILRAACSTARAPCASTPDCIAPRQGSPGSRRDDLHQGNHAARAQHREKPCLQRLELERAPHDGKRQDPL